MFETLKNSPSAFHTLAVEALSKSGRPKVTLARCMKRSQRSFRKHLRKQGHLLYSFFPGLATSHLSDSHVRDIQNIFLMHLFKCISRDDELELFAIKHLLFQLNRSPEETADILSISTESIFSAVCHTFQNWRQP